jgi:hypothetical protein
MYHPAKTLQQEYQKLEAWIRNKGQWSAIQEFVLLMNLDKFSNDKILAGGLLRIFFEFSIFIM